MHVTLRASLYRATGLSVALPGSAAPRFSVVIPLFNKERDVQRAILSVLAQKVADFEIVVVDDGSTDGSPERVAEIHDPRLRVIRQANAGEGAARNTGIRAASGAFVCLLDADDEWKPVFLDLVNGLIEKHSDAGLYAVAYEVVEPDGQCYPARIVTMPPMKEGGILSYFVSATLGAPPVWSSAVCIPRGVFDDVGYFREGVPMGADLDYWARVALRYPIAFTPAIGAVYRRDAADRPLASVKSRRPWVFARTAANELRNCRDPAFARTVRTYVAKKLREDAIFSLWNGETAAARDILREMPRSPAHAKAVGLRLLALLPAPLCRLLPSRLQRWFL